MNGYRERKGINKAVLLLIIVIIIAIIYGVFSTITHNKEKERLDKIEKYFGTYEVSIDNFNKYGSDVTGKKIIDINKENINMDELITSSKINFIEFDSIDAILIYFNNIATTNSKNEERINELGFMKLCFTKDGDNLKQLDCPNMVNEQNLGESAPNYFIEYKKKTN